MAEELKNVEFARNNEDFADDIEESRPDRLNWVVTIRFYSYLHFLEERLTREGYSQNDHDDRRTNTQACSAIDNKAYKVYRFLEDLSRNARYECVVMTEEDAEKALEWLQEGKDVLGFTGEGSGTTKYSVDG